MKKFIAIVATAIAFAVVVWLAFFAYHALVPCEYKLRKEIKLVMQIADRVHEFKEQNNMLPTYSEVGLRFGGYPTINYLADGEFEVRSTYGVHAPEHPASGTITAGYDGPWVKYSSLDNSVSCSMW